MKRSIIALAAASVFLLSTANAQSIPTSGVKFNFTNLSGNANNYGQDVKININDESGSSLSILTCQAASISEASTQSCYNENFRYPTLPVGTIALVTQDNQHRCDYHYEVTYDVPTYTYHTSMTLTGSANATCVQDYSTGWTYDFKIPG